MMRGRPHILHRILGALVCAALALSPLTALAASKASSGTNGHHATMSEEMPCDMPCDGCADGKMPFSCIVACSGLIGSMPIAEAVLRPTFIAGRVSISLIDRFSARQREPDTPPPKLILA